MFRGVRPSGSLSISLPESGEVKEVKVGYLPLKVLSLSKEERKRYWNKTIVGFEGEVALAELVLRTLADRQGFDAV